MKESRKSILKKTIKKASPQPSPKGEGDHLLQSSSLKHVEPSFSLPPWGESEWGFLTFSSWLA